MEITSLQYFYFVAVFLLLYSLSNQKSRPLLLLSGSYLFYGSQSIVLLTTLILSTFINYKIHQSKYKNSIPLIVLFNVGLLFTFKLSGAFNWNDRLIPIGISFFTFQALSFHFDNKESRSTRNTSLLSFANYLSFFPQLIAGPIEKYSKLSPQIDQGFQFKLDNIIKALYWIGLGLVKKLIIADRCRVIVDSVYNNLEETNLINFLIATVLFSFQIYLDFSAYCNIASGVAKLFNVDLSLNFRSPYLSKSISEFWQRWHITLHLWFKEYVFKKVIKNGLFLSSVAIVFILSGLWHGLKIHFIIWALFSIVAFFLDRLILQKLPLPFFIKGITTFSLVTMGWIFFRVHSITDITQIPISITPQNLQDLENSLGDFKYMLFNYDSAAWFGKINLVGQEFGLTHLDFIILLFALLFWGLFTIINSFINLLQHKIIFSFIFFLLISLIGFNSISPFIYLQF